MSPEPLSAIIALAVGLAAGVVFRRASGWWWPRGARHRAAVDDGTEAPIDTPAPAPASWAGPAHSTPTAVVEEPTILTGVDRQELDDRRYRLRQDTAAIIGMSSAILFVAILAGSMTPPEGVAFLESDAPASGPLVTGPLATATPAGSQASTNPSPTASSPAVPSPSLVPSSSPTSDRYELLEPCPDEPECWIYTVRSGDNLYSIAGYFGIPLETINDRNPGLEPERLLAGTKLRMPPPTR